MHCFLKFSVPRSSSKVTSIGCFYDITWRRAISSLEKQDPLLDGDNYKSRKDAIEKCASVAKKRGYKVFAVQDGGMCLSSSTAHKTFNIYGTSSGCTFNGRGGNKANHVYVIGGLQGMITLFKNFIYLKFLKPRTSSNLAMGNSGNFIWKQCEQSARC